MAPFGKLPSLLTISFHLLKIPKQVNKVKNVSLFKMFKKSLTKNYNLNEHFLHLKFDFLFLGLKKLKQLILPKTNLTER